MHKDARSVIISLEDVGLPLRFAASRLEPRIVGVFDDTQPRFSSRMFKVELSEDAIARRESYISPSILPSFSITRTYSRSLLTHPLSLMFPWSADTFVYDIQQVHPQPPYEKRAYSLEGVFFLFFVLFVPVNSFLS